MHKILKLIHHHKKEIAYQVAIVLLLFLFFSYNQDETLTFSYRTLVAPYKLAFFGNYLVGAMVINYVLLPRLYYKKQTLAFMLTVAALLTGTILIDELILEKIFFPDTRGTYFPGIPYTLLETLPIIIIIVAFKFAWDNNRKQTELEQLEKLMRESEIQFLKSQINPHFLFNNLHTLYAFAIAESPKTPAIILELASVLRYMLYDCKEDFVPLSKEVQHLKNYIALHELQIQARGKVVFREDLASEKFAIPPLILMVFIENAFKHSMGSQSANIEIDIRLKVTSAGGLSFRCENNFSPDHSSQDIHQGIGLENVKKRLALVYPNLHTLHIQREESRFTIDLTLQLKPED